MGRIMTMTSICLIVLVAGGYITDKVIVERQTAYMATMIVNEMKQNIVYIEYFAPREHYLENSQTPEFYAPAANNRKVWNTFYDKMLEGLNEPISIPLVKIYRVAMFSDGFNLDATAYVKFAVFPGQVKSIYIDVTTTLPRFKNPAGYTLVGNKPLNQNWKVKVLDGGYPITLSN